MKEAGIYIFSVFCGIAVLVLATSYYENKESAQKIENIKTLYELKSNLENKKFNEDTDRWIKETQLKIDSLQNLK